MIFANTVAELAPPPVRTIDDVRREIAETDAALGRNGDALKQALTRDGLAAALFSGRLQLRPGTDYRVPANIVEIVRERESLLRRWTELLQEHAALKRSVRHD